MIAQKLSVRERCRLSIAGYCAVFWRSSLPDTQYRLAANTVERIAPGAFDATLRQCNVLATINHDGSRTIACTADGTLQLGCDSFGVWFRIAPVPFTPAGNAAIDGLHRGAFRGASFTSQYGRDTWTTEAGQRVRTLEMISLAEIALASKPAYRATLAALHRR